MIRAALAVVLLTVLTAGPAYATHCGPVLTHTEWHWYKTGAGTAVQHWGSHQFQNCGSVHWNGWHSH